jgi:phospholipid/cholesterol/gamma-HCH transport system substrate-binding protein
VAEPQQNGQADNGQAGGADAGRGIRDQIERYRTAFLAVVTMIVIAAISGGYILAHERLKLPGWVPVLGQNDFTLKADFSTAQAVTPGQGEAVTIAGAKIGEIASVDLNQGLAVVSMNVTPKYSRYIYKNATMILRPKTELKDITVEVNPGTSSAGRLRSGEVIPVSQTSPDINFDEFLGILDGETRAYLQELLAAGGQGLKNNGANLAAALKRFSPLARNVQEITAQLQKSHESIRHSIHNFRLLIEAIGGKDTQLTQVIDASNAVFRVFKEQDHNLQETLHLLPGALSKAKTNLGKLSTAFNVVTPTLKALHPFATSLAPAEEATRPFFSKTTPILKNEIEPFLREILPAVNKLKPATQSLAEASPNLATSFSVLNEFFNEIAYNPGPNQGGFLFFLDWANHNFNSVLSTADAHGTLGRTVVYFNCEVVPLLVPVSKVNPTVRLIIGLLNPPSSSSVLSNGGKACPTAASTAAGATTKAAASQRRPQTLKGAGVFGKGQASLAGALSAIGGGH